MNQIDTLQYIPFPMPDTTLGVEAHAHADTAVFSLDSILAHLEHTESEEVPSLFLGHTLKVNDFQPTSRLDNSSPAWVFGVVIMSIVGLCIYFRSHSLGIRTIFQSMFSHRAMDRIMRENNMNHMAVLAPIALIWGADLALLLFYLVYHYGTLHLPGMGSWQAVIAYLVLIAGCTGLFHLRNTLLRLIGHTFEEGAASATFIMSNYLYTLLEATFTIPLMLVLFYGEGVNEIFLFFIVGVVALLFIIRVARGLKLFLTLANSSYLHLFYYLCIVEFGPLLVLLKVVNIL